MTEETFNNSMEHSAPGAQPNFEDERTLLSARPVVPLARIDAKERKRRHWLLGGAFALAMMLGAASALVASYLKLRNVPSATTQLSGIDTPVTPVAAAAEPAADQLPPVENPETAANTEALAETTEEAAPAVTPKKARSIRRAAPVDRDTELVRPRVVTRGDDEEDDLDRIREAVLIEQWQERRARRAARRERRNRLDHHDRDLSNLDEIFQGRRRP